MRSFSVVALMGFSNISVQAKKKSGFPGSNQSWCNLGSVLPLSIIITHNHAIPIHNTVSLRNANLKLRHSNIIIKNGKIGIHFLLLLFLFISLNKPYKRHKAQWKQQIGKSVEYHGNSPEGITAQLVSKRPCSQPSSLSTCVIIISMQ